MRMNKTKVLALALAVCMLAIASFSSLAWFTHQDSVTNDFLIAGSEDQNPDKVFSVDVWEEDANGVRYDDGMQFPAIEPGDDLYKEVNIENTGAYAQYVRVIVTVTDAHIWQEIFEGEEHFPLTYLVTDLNENFESWAVICDEVADTMIYVLNYNTTLAFEEGFDVVNLFTNVHIPEAMDRYQAAEMQNFQINVVAQAVQTQNVGANAAEAFETVGMPIEEGSYCLTKDTTLTYAGNSPYVLHNAIFENVNIESTRAGFQTENADVVLYNVTMAAGSTGDYATILTGGNVTFNDVVINSKGGVIGAVAGVQLTINSGKYEMNSTSTSSRYIVYAVGEGTVVTINDGEFVDFTKTTQNQKRSYVYAGAGTTVYINGGTFGAQSTRQAGIVGDGTVIITGGTFGFNPSEWVAEGYEAVYDAEAKTWTVVEIA